jgi:preprotein translocase subunit YajC
MSQQFPLPLLLLFVVAFVVLVVLPTRQRKKLATQAKSLQDSLTPGTPVLTTAGLHATVVGLGATTVDLEIAPGVVATFERRAILQAREPASSGGATAEAPRDSDPRPDVDPGGAPGGGATGLTR